MLELTDLQKRYGDVVALAGCEFSVPRGHLVGFVGANGAGKTTTMRAVFGLVALDRGSVSWEGRAVDASERLRFGYMPEERGLYPRMPTLEQLVFFAQLHGADRVDSETQAKAILARLGLQPAARPASSSSPTEISNASSSPQRWCIGRRCSYSTSRSLGSTHWPSRR